MSPPTVDGMMARLFDRPRDPRSAAYKAGVRMALSFRIIGVKFTCPYPQGGAENDAFYAGALEGHAAWRAAIAGEIL